MKSITIIRCTGIKIVVLTAYTTEYDEEFIIVIQHQTRFLTNFNVSPCIF